MSPEGKLREIATSAGKFLRNDIAAASGSIVMLFYRSNGFARFLCPLSKILLGPIGKTAAKPSSPFQHFLGK